MRALVAYLAFWSLASVDAFLGTPTHQHCCWAGRETQAQPATVAYLAATETDGNEVVAKRILVKGDVQGGYYRACVLNEVSRAQRPPIK